MTIQGADWYSGDAHPRLDGFDFAIIKATEGRGYSDPGYAAERARIKNAGLVFGCYHFPHPELNAMNAEIDHFLGYAQPQPGDILMLDFEPTGSNWDHLSNAQLTTYATSWINEVKRRQPGHRVILYMGAYNYKTRLNGSYVGDGLMVAAYGSSSPGIHDPWLIWQYSETGHNPGGRYDQDVANFPSRAAMAAWANPSAPAPAPLPPVEEESDMLLCNVIPDPVTGTNVGIWMLSGGLYFHVTDPNPDLSSFAAAGIKSAQIDYAQHLEILAATRSGQALTGALAVSGSLNVAPKG